ncbi:MAG: DUF2852 domain-containing protein [bacterium]
MNSTRAQACPRFREQFRPACTFWNMVIMIVSFSVGLWPIGLFMIAYMVWGKEWGLDFSTWGNVEKSMSRAGEKMKSAFNDTFDGTAYSNRTHSTGNAAFDEWRAEELRRLEEERRKLEEARRDFEKYAAELRKAKDREEFNRFREQWARKSQEDSPQAD